MDSPKMAIGVDLGGTNMRVGLVNPVGEVIHKVNLRCEAHMGPQPVISNLCRAVMDLAEKAVDMDCEVGSVGLGIPGNLLVEQGLMVMSPNMPGWRDLDLKKMLGEHLPFPIILDNDANMIALGEKWKGAGTEFRHFICITLGTGVGGGLILDGKIWHGHWGSGGEVGHMVLEPDGRTCSCGNKGCLESMASATAICNNTLKALDQGEHSILIPYLQKPEDLTAHEVARAARRGDELAVGIFKEVGKSLGLAIVNIMNLLGLEAFLIGGGVSAAWDLFYPWLIKELRQSSKLFPADIFQVLRNKLGDDAGILGAAYAAFEAGKDENMS